jgi:hypothetical protein
VHAFIDRGVNEALAVALAQGKPLIAHELDWLAKQPSPTLPRKVGQAAGGWNQTKELTLEGLGIVRGFNLDARVQVSTRDITRYRLAQILLSYPVDGPKSKIRQPKARFQKKRRAPTERELEGLRIGNAKRAEAAVQKREAKVASGV